LSLRIAEIIIIGKKKHKNECPLVTGAVPGGISGESIDWRVLRVFSANKKLKGVSDHFRVGVTRLL